MNQATTEKSLEPIKKDLSLVVREAEALTVKNIEEVQSASDILNRIGQAEDKIKAEKEKLTKPAQEIIKWARGVFSPLELNCKKAERIIKDKMIVFSDKEDEKKRKELEKISKEIAEGKIDIDKGSDKIKDLEVKGDYAGDEGSIQFRKRRIIVITDLTKVPRKFLKPDEALIKKELLDNGGKIPGCEVRIEKTVAKVSL